MQRRGYVYIMATWTGDVLYTGVTARLEERVYEHREKLIENSFSSKYNCTKLVWYKEFSGIEQAIEEEKRIKAGNRWNKTQLISELNPQWEDMWDSIKR